jgi:flagellin-like hook-associated protein FlgL
MQMADVNLSKAVRSNLLSLQSTAANMAKTQSKLATGLKVNSALDNPSNFFTASALNSRAGDMANLMDSMASGIQTIEAADNGLKSITKTVESMQSTLRQARQDKSFQTASYTLPTSGMTGSSTIGFSGGAVGTTPVDVELTKGTAGVATVTFGAGGTLDTAATLNFDITVDGGSAQSVSITQADLLAVGDNNATMTADEFRTILTSKNVTGVTVGGTGSAITLTSSSLGTTSDVNITAATLGGTAGTSTITPTLAGMNAVTNGTAGAADGGAAKTVDELVAEINGPSSSLVGMVRASNDNGKLRIENQSTQKLTVDGVSSSGAIDGSSSGAAEIGGNDVRKNLVKQFNELRDQLDKFSDDASFNGINLLRGDKLKLTFNETGTSTIEIQAKDKTNTPTAINNASLGITNAVESDFDSDSALDTRLDALKSSLDTLRSQASTFGSNLSVVENRQDFTKNMINTLETGAANLTLADTNEEAANLLALQTRQQLSSSALSMASQADQAVLRLF